MQIFNLEARAGTIIRPAFLACLLSVALAYCRKDASKSISFSTQKTNSIVFNNIVVLGNSITICPPNSAIGWFSTWGMAASSRNADFVHVLEANYQKINPSARVFPVNISAWEINPQEFDLSTLDNYLTSSTDLVIIRIGENVKQTNELERSLTKLISYIKSKSTKTKLLISGVFWANAEKENVLKRVAAVNNAPFVPISYLHHKNNESSIGSKVLGDDGSFYKITDEGVAKHPADLGMWKLAALMYNEMVNYAF